MLTQQLLVARNGTPSSRVATRSGELAYWTKGHGAPVLLVHGNSAGKEVFAPQMAYLADQGYRAVAIDLPGHGESENAREPERDYTITGYATALHEVIARLELANALVIGWSLGGHIAIEMAGRGYPLSGLVLSGTPPCGPGISEFSATFLPTPAMAVTGSQSPTAAELAVFLAHVFRRLDPVPEVYASLAARTDGRARRIMLEAAIAGVEGCHQRTVIRGWEKPVAVLQGIEEPFFTNAGLAPLGWRNLWRSQIFEIANAAHAPFMENPTAYNELLGAFLTDHYPAQPR